ncbi:MAG: carboxypeptidase regulatory-like domain-containing protein [Sandaracinaceae bacterium]
MSPVWVRGLAGANVMLLAAMAVTARAQAPIVRVRAETRIELSAERAPTGASLHANLRDDRGDPLPDRVVSLRVYRAGERGVLERAELRTGTDGRATAPFELERGEYRIEADYAGEERYRGVRVEQALDLERVHVRLGMSIAGDERLDRLNLDLESHVLRVHADSALGGEGLEVTLSNELNEVLARGVTDAAGELELAVSSAALGPPAAGRLIVRTAGDAERSAAQTEVLVVRYLATSLTLEADADRMGHGGALRIRGQLRTSRGPLARKAIGVFAGSHHVLTALTDDDGRFARELTLSDPSFDDASAVGSIALTARFASDAPWRPDAESPPLSIAVESAPRAAWGWIALSIAVTLLLVFLLSRRGATPAAERSAAVARPQVARGIVAVGASAGRGPTSTKVAGTALDADEGEPIVGSHVTLTMASGGSVLRAVTDASGRFAIDAEGESGRATLAIDAPGFERRSTSLELPHRGEWSDARVGLRSLRRLAIEGYAPLAEKLAPARRFWAFWTPRELAHRAKSDVRDAVGTLTDDVERAAYSAAVPSEDDVAAIGSQASALADRTAHDREDLSR